MPRGPTFKDGGSTDDRDEKDGRERDPAVSRPDPEDLLDGTPSPNGFTTASERRTQRNERAARRQGPPPGTAAADASNVPTDAGGRGEKKRPPANADREPASRVDAAIASADDLAAESVERVRDRPGGDVAAGVIAVGAPAAVAEPTPFGEVGVAGAAGAALLGGAAAATVAERRGVFGESELPVTRGRKTFVEQPEIPVATGGETTFERPELPVGRGRVEREIPVSEGTRDQPEVPVSESVRDQPEVPLGGRGGERFRDRQDESVVPEEFPLPGRDFPADPTRDVIRRERDAPAAGTETIVDQPTQPGDLLGPRGPTIDDTRREFPAERDFPTGGGAVVGRDEATEPTIPFEDVVTPAVAQSQEGPTRDVETFGPPQPGGPAEILKGVGAGAGAAAGGDAGMGEAPGMLDESDRVVNVDEPAPGVLDEPAPGVDTTAPTDTATGTGDDFLTPPAPEFGPETPPDFGTPGETVFPDEPALETPTGTETGEVPALGDPAVPGTPGPGPGPGPGGLPLGAFPGGSAAPADKPRAGVFERVFRNPVADPVEFVEGDADRRDRRATGGLFGDLPDVGGEMAAEAPDFSDVGGVLD